MSKTLFDTSIYTLIFIIILLLLYIIFIILSSSDSFIKNITFSTLILKWNTVIEY